MLWCSSNKPDCCVRLNPTISSCVYQCDIQPCAQAALHTFFGPPECTTQMANRSVQQFLHSSRHTVPILYNGQPFSKIGPFMGVWTPSNTWFLGPFRDHNPNGTTIVLAVFAQVTAECPYILPREPLSRKLPFPWGSGPSI